MKWFFIFFLFAFHLGSSAMETDLLERAAQFFSENSFEEAAEIYEELIQTSGPSADLYYNLANCYHRLGALVQARLYYERALILDPNDSSIMNNLEMLTLQLESGQEVLFTSLFDKISFEFSGWLSAEKWAYLFTISSWLVLILGLIWLFAQRRSIKKVGFYIGILGLIISLLSFSLGRERSKYENNSNYHITLNKKGAKIYLAPDILSPVIDNIPQGKKSLLIDSLDTWYKVWLEKDIQGWVKKEDGEKI
ncbi:MAG: tetratricopeptide repeat protein [Saprospiraceae bacterium]|jgi:tetratricopeptide (TPR) repeat protein